MKKINITWSAKFFIIGIVSILLLGCKKDAPQVIPTVTLTAATNITAISASGGGYVTTDGGATVISRGVCWSSTNASPTTSDSKTSDGTGPGSFTSSLPGLTQGTTYNLIAYATNSVGTGYSSASSFKTLALAPTLTTTDLSAVTATSFNSGGNIFNDGGSPVTARGVCWSINQNPITSDSKTSDGTGTGFFTSSVTGLTAGTTYYVRAYATNSIGTTYGNQLSTKTSAVVPTLTTTAVSLIASTTVTSGGNITSDGGGAITTRGVCWSITTGPTTASSKTSDATGTGIFTSSITGLTANTTYYVKAYATNSAGTAYGGETSFKTAIIVANGLVAYFPFNGNANDESGNGNNGIVYGASLISDKRGNLNKAYFFNGITDYIQIDNFNTINLGTSNFTFSCWIKPGKMTPWGKTIFSKSPTYSFVNGSKSIVLSTQNSVGFDSYGKCYNVIKDLIYEDQWYHVVCISLINSKTCNFYINNVKYYLNHDPQAPLVPDLMTDVTFIGRKTTGIQDFFDGIIDEIRIYNRELSEQEISALYQENK